MVWIVVIGDRFNSSGGRVSHRRGVVVNCASNDIYYTILYQVATFWSCSELAEVTMQGEVLGRRVSG